MHNISTIKIINNFQVDKRKKKRNFYLQAAKTVRKSDMLDNCSMNFF